MNMYICIYIYVCVQYVKKAALHKIINLEY